MDGIKSKARVKEHGEVFTPDSIVGDMLDLIDNELREANITAEEYILESYLEPACGNGNFLIRILDRKLAAVRLLDADKHVEGLIKAVSSIYGIDIQEDNVLESIDRMMKLIENGEVDVLELKDKEVRSFVNGGGFKLDPVTKEIVEFILRKNIVLGNALETDESKAVKFINWGFSGSTIEPKYFYMTNVDNDMALDNTRTHWENLMDLNYEVDESIMEF